MIIQEKYPLKQLNTFGIDASARYYAEVQKTEELNELKQYNKLPYSPLLILGSGSNMLFTRDYPGMIIKNSLKGIEVIEKGDDKVLVKAASGEVWHDLVVFCVESGFYGIENLSLIPGTVGAAPVQNIGAYGVELKDVFGGCEVYDMESGSIQYFGKEDCAFGYRDSIFKRRKEKNYFITSVIIELGMDKNFNTSYSDIAIRIKDLSYDALTIKNLSDIVVEIRQAKLPDPEKLGNAGSFFKNPVVSEKVYETLKTAYPDVRANPAGPGFYKLAAAWLIEKAGWKGKRIGQVGCHPVQPLVIVNYGAATGKEVIDYAKELKRDIFGKFNIELEFEVNIF